MNSEQHKKAAEALLGEIEADVGARNPKHPGAMHLLLAQAQVHATLALVPDPPEAS